MIIGARPGAHTPVVRRARRPKRLLAALVGAALAAALPAGVAVADTAPPSGTPATVSADALPTWQVNGVVWSQVVVGTTVYVTGNFTKARPPGVAAGGSGEVSAPYLFAYDITTGNRVASFNHALNAQGRTITRSPDGSRIYVGGDFTTVDGLNRGHVAAFNTSDGSLVSGFAPAVSNQVAAMTASNDTLWFGGSFFNVNGVGRTRLAAVTSAGALKPWAPKADDNNVAAMVLAPAGDRVIVGGSFSTLNGVSAPGMGSVDATTGATLPWAANQRINDAGKGSGITSLSTDGTNIYGTGFAYSTGSFEGSFAANPSTGDIVLVNDCHGDTYSAQAIGGVLYTVSHAHDCSAIRSFGDTTSRRALAFTVQPQTTNTGPDSYGWNYGGLPASALLQWFPDLGIGSFTGQSQAAWSVTGTSDYVALGGEFPSANGIAQQGLVRYAVKAKAPNKRGPVRPPNPSDPSASAGFGSITVQWQSATDMDNNQLTYTVYRSGTAAPVYTTTSGSTFWSYPTLSFRDTSAPSGSTVSYTVKVSDPSGNTLTLPTTGTVRAR